MRDVTSWILSRNSENREKASLQAGKISRKKPFTTVLKETLQPKGIWMRGALDDRGFATSCVFPSTEKEKSNQSISRKNAYKEEIFITQESQKPLENMLNSHSSNMLLNETRQTVHKCGTCLSKERVFLFIERTFSRHLQ